ncbi:hypothetical protein Cni_G22246 [Canna indica]|uniref:Uncharacterized protein n=1 Tax=Canna indica TaxID=4628 RepID=A0AAQ3QI26_9LILI|nr:hypothetical protein Cni_G22246 [Canna indica]
MSWWRRKVVFPVRRAWLVVSSRVKSRKHGGGILKLYDDVQMCGYQDVQVMWDILTRSEMETPTMSKQRKRSFWRPSSCHACLLQPSLDSFIRSGDLTLVAYVIDIGQSKYILINSEKSGSADLEFSGTMPELLYRTYDKIIPSHFSVVQTLLYGATINYDIPCMVYHFAVCLLQSVECTDYLLSCEFSGPSANR